MRDYAITFKPPTHTYRMEYIEDATSAGQLEIVVHVGDAPRGEEERDGRAEREEVNGPEVQTRVGDVRLASSRHPHQEVHRRPRGARNQRITETNEEISQKVAND